MTEKPETGTPSAPMAQPASLPAVLETAADKTRAGIRCAMATVLRRSGSAPGTPGQKLLVADDGTCVGSVGGGALEAQVIAEAKLVMVGHKEGSVREVRLGPELGMCCGGRVEVLIERLAIAVPCLVVGAGHVASAVAPLLASVGFAVTVVDAREEDWPARFVGVACVRGDFDDLRDFPVEGACLVMTHDHALDQRAIEWALSRGFAFVGGIGSRAKAERTRTRLEAKGFAKDASDRVRMPLGVSIGARSPEEIAVSVAAELIAWRRERPR